MQPRLLFVTEEDYNTQFSVWQSRWSIGQSYDGDGQRLVQQENGASFPTLFLRSSVMGGTVVGEINKINGTWYKDVFVYAGGEIIAQQKDNPTTADEVKFMYTNPITGAQRGAVDSEPDPLGTDQGLVQQQPNPPIYSGDSGIMDPGRYRHVECRMKTKVVRERGSRFAQKRLRHPGSFLSQLQSKEL